jgi:hypothetical protein
MAVAGRRDDASGGDAQAVLGTALSGKDGSAGDDQAAGGPIDVPATLVAPGPGDAGSGPPVLLLMLLAFVIGFAAVWTFQHHGSRGARGA